MPPKVIGTVTRYTGTEHGYLTGYKVRVVAVFKPRNDSAYLTDDDEIARAGGVTGADRFEVQPRIREEGRFSFVTSDPRAVDLEAFAHLAHGTDR
ncbi:MAG: hypothetical protein JXB39_10790 [Deltaproteobacteria bacterium]|nr:hypothetical protein [Deltaproteobacteria bacterium]